MAYNIGHCYKYYGFKMPVVKIVWLPDSNKPLDFLLPIETGKWCICGSWEKIKLV